MILIFILDLCLCLFYLLNLFFFLISFRLILLFCGVYFIINNLVYFIDWNIITLNGRSIIINFLFVWISTLFMGFVFIVYLLYNIYINIYICGPGCSVGIATELWAGQSWIEFRGVGGGQIFRPSGPAQGPTQPSVKWVPGLSRG